jgi:hypothetical protein
LQLKPLRRKPVLEPHVVVKAAPYSGTLGICHILQSIGRAVGHEEVKAHGISAWYYAHFDRENWASVGFRMDTTILHQVRHPLMVISGLMGCTGLPWKIQRGIIKLRNLPVKMSDNRAEQSMIFWLWWNKMAARDADYTYKIEILPFEWDRFLFELNIGTEGFPYISTIVHRHTAKKIFSWDDLYKINPYLTMDILELAHIYGYTQVPYTYLRDQNYQFPKRIKLTLATSPCL